MAASQQTLQIFNLQRDDYGVYQCFVARCQTTLFHLIMETTIMINAYMSIIDMKNPIDACVIGFCRGVREVQATAQLRLGGEKH